MSSPRLPDGFEELLRGMSREVLRAQPHDVLGFITRYFQALLAERERDLRDSWPPVTARTGELRMELLSGSRAKTLPSSLTRGIVQEGACTKLDEDILDIPLDDPDANAAAAKIQASFRGHMTRKKIKGGEMERKAKDAECANSTRGGDLRNGD
ncbi:hypothetical protein ASZ78_015476 [Callipepla squamata]|uniref:Sperm surface protein Sp17 n=1 Tax=Callipepla squamata TaxID=9009 RepID=A0A226ML58_CALSU|nr:hypothetical protein ASZ78_015476 [Callipepla squamata]